MRDIAINTLLFVGVLSFLLTAVGLAWFKDVYDKLHFGSLGATIGISAFVLGILLHDGFSQSGIKSIIAGVAIVITNPILTHATARAARIRQLGEIMPGSDPSEQDQAEDAQNVSS